MVLHAPKITNDRQQFFGNCVKNPTYYRMFAVCNFVWYAVRCSLFGTICYWLFGITCSNYMSSEYSITTSFLKNISNFINHSLTLFLSVLTQSILYSWSVQKVAKSKSRDIFIVLYVCIVLDKKSINLFRKTMLPIIMVYQKFNETTIIS